MTSASSDEIRDQTDPRHVEIGGQFQKRIKHKCPFRQTRVRDNEPLGRDPLIGKDQKIEIERPGTPMDTPGTPLIPLDTLANRDESERIERGFDLDHCVAIIRLPVGQTR